MFNLLRWLLALVACLVATAPAAALEVHEVIWGFDGRITLGRLQPVSVLVSNPDAEAFNGTLKFFQTTTGGIRLDVEYRTPAYLSPGSSRWVQFYPYVERENQTWALAWGSGARQRVGLPEPRAGRPARVMLMDPNRPGRLTGAGLKILPDNLLPPTVAAMDGLHSVVLDYVPQWEPVRRQALADWIARGGTLHLLQEASGRYPQFTDELTVLNLPVERQRVGAGWVVRHPISRSGLSEVYLTEAGFPALRPSEQTSGWTVDTAFLSALRDLTRPEHSWGLIYLLIVGYFLLLGPINFLVGRYLRDYRVALVLLVAVVAGFALLFHRVGRRGYGEVTTVHSFAYARPVRAGQFDVTQWTNAFVTRGDLYTIHHAGPHNLYATGSDEEMVGGFIQSGKDGRFVADVPVYSSRSFVHRGVMAGPDLEVRVVPGEDGKPALAVSEALRRQVLEAWVVRDERLIPVDVSSERWEVQEGHAGPLDVNSLQQKWGRYGWHRYYYKDDTIKPVDQLQQMVQPAIVRALGLMDGVEKPSIKGPTDWQVFILAHAPPEFAVQNPNLGQQMGVVLYHVTLPEP